MTWRLQGASPQLVQAYFDSAKARFAAALIAAILVAAPVLGAAHAAEHHGSVDSVDCGTCHWSNDVAGTAVEAPALVYFAAVEPAPSPSVTQPDLRLRASEFHTRGPPSVRV